MNNYLQKRSGTKFIFVNIVPPPQRTGSWQKIIVSFHFDLLQRSLQYLTSSQFFSHFFLHENGSLHTMHIFSGKLTFLCAIISEMIR